MRLIIGRRLVMKHFGVCNVKESAKKVQRLRLITVMASVMTPKHVSNSLLMGKLFVLNLIPVYA